MSVAPSPRTRNDAIDLLRGAVMVLMALDHVRDFFGSFRSDPTNLATTTPALFLTRWVTHFCAPVFILLAGTAAYLYGSRGKTPREIAGFLATRGAWLVVLELTVVRTGWMFDVSLSYFILQVIWAIGCSMLVLSLLVFLPRWAIAAIGIALVAGHNALDTTHVHGVLAPVWTVLHDSGRVGSPRGLRAFVLYPLIPWIGVMACGYVLGAWALLSREIRRRRLFALGIGLVTAFIVLRALNVYGDPEPWRVQRNALFTAFSFINCEKYPPSLAYLLMTLGPAFVAWALLERPTPRVLMPLLAYGRVPLFYYVLHLYAIHAAATIVDLARHGTSAWSASHGRNLGLGLGAIYVVWILVVAALYPACAWFARVKATKRAWWLSYL